MIDIKDVLELPGVTLDQAGPDSFSGPGFDSRRLEPDSLFFALAGERDGHDFIDAAVAGGATGVVVSKPVSVPAGVAVLTVPDTLKALQQLGRSARQGYGGTLIAITGSAGKTTLRGIVADVLGTAHRVHASVGSFNNHLGLPLTLLGIEDEHTHAVLEVGTNSRGEIQFLGLMAEPDIAIVSNVGFAHIGNFESPEEIATEKADLLRSVRPGGTWIINGDDARLMAEVERIDRPDVTCIKVGHQAGNDWLVSDLVVDEDGTSGVVEFGGSTHRFRLALHGRHFATAAAMALAVGVETGIGAEQAIAALGRVAPQAGRAGVIRIDDRLLAIDDTYNASPDAMLAGLDLLDDIDGDNKIAVLGEMRELGDWSPRLHETVVGRAMAVADRVIVIGGETSDIAKAASAIDDTGARRPATVVDSATAAYNTIARWQADFTGSTVVFVKGARFAHTERVILGLQGRTPRCDLTVCPLYINCRTCDRLEAG
ncbi:MAG: UDP-N-acetylmuramoyl-tripeptide--D-alanyl-D-alanine ligase [Acidimicrobiales bacterium]